MSAPEDVEAVLVSLLAEHEFIPKSAPALPGHICRFINPPPEGCGCLRIIVGCTGCDWQAEADGHQMEAHRAHVAAVLAAYVVEKQREAVEAAAAERVTWPRTANSFAVGQRVYAATTYPTPKETP